MTLKDPLPIGWLTVLVTVLAVLVSGAMSWGVTQEHISNAAVHPNAELIVFRLQAIEVRLANIEHLLANP